MDSSKLPSRENLESLSQIVLDLEKIKISQPENSTKYKKNFKKNLPTKGNVVPHTHKKEFLTGDGRNSHYKSLLQSKDQQIDKLVDKLSTLYNYNSQYAIDNEALKRENQFFRDQFEDANKSKADTVEFLERERKKFTKETEELRNDLKMMKILVYRLNIQLEKDQEVIKKLGGGKENYTDTYSVQNDDDLQWGDVNTHTLGPLLHAYHEMINEKNDLIQQYENELNVFTGDFKEMLKENEYLHGEIEQMKNSHSNWSTEKSRLQSQLEVYQTKAETQTRRADLAKEKLVEVLKCYEKKINLQQLEMDRLQEAYQRSKRELINLRDLNKQPDAVVDSLKECQRLFEELKVQHDSEKNRLVSEYEELKKSSKEFDKKFNELKEDNTDMKGLIQKLKELNKTLLSKNIKFRQKYYRLKSAHDTVSKQLKAHSHRRNLINERNAYHQHNQSVNNYQDMKIRNMQMNYLAEIENLTRKLQQREETLKLVLKEKAQNTKSKKK